MYLDVVDLRAFYAERLGQIARRLIGERLKRRWPSVAGEPRARHRLRDALSPALRRATPSA